MSVKFEDSVIEVRKVISKFSPAESTLLTAAIIYLADTIHEAMSGLGDDVYRGANEVGNSIERSQS